ncbi:MAG: hypothetical protein JKY46_01900 [Robiginitomaculum sp.]|nr:hypothetical protein [Robiginitomaculum sp.]
MPVSFLVIDDFLQDPMAFRKVLTELEYPQVNVVKGYPGRNSGNAVRIPGLENEISRLVQENIVPKNGAGHAKARLTLAGEVGAADIHVDDCYWSAILYMTLPEYCQGGTSFFSHKETGMDQATLSDADIKKLGVSNRSQAAEVYNNILKNDAHDHDKWNLTMQVPMRFNRLVLLRPWLWHTAEPGFGQSIEDGRLVYLMFFTKPGAE